MFYLAVLFLYIAVIVVNDNNELIIMFYYHLIFIIIADLHFHYFAKENDIFFSFLLFLFCLVYFSARAQTFFNMPNKYFTTQKHVTQSS